MPSALMNWWGRFAVSAQAAAADLQRVQAFLQAFLERAADGHRFAHAFHLRGERELWPGASTGLWEFPEGKARPAKSVANMD